MIVNELGEVSLDHLFVQKLTESTIVLKNGCICCTMREDLQTGLRELIDNRDRGLIAPFDRVVIETTGLADPTPIAMTLDGDLLLKRQVRLANIIATIDAMFGADQLREHEESMRQAAIADRLVLTKTDIASKEETARTREKIHAVNPMAVVLDACSLESLWTQLFDIDPFDPRTKSSEVQHWLKRLPSIEVLKSSRSSGRYQGKNGKNVMIRGYHKDKMKRRRDSDICHSYRKTSELDSICDLAVSTAAPPWQSYSANQGAAECSRSAGTGRAECSAESYHTADASG